MKKNLSPSCTLLQSAIFLHTVLMLGCIGVTSFAASASSVRLRGNTSENDFAFTVSGKVTNEKGEAIPGVNVVERGTASGTVTDANGKYTLVVADENSSLVFSFIGYTNQEIPVNGRATIDVAMLEDVAALAEVVVVGYGTQKKSDFTGSIASVKGEDITLMPTQRVDQALQGRAAGVLVLNTD